MGLCFQSFGLAELLLLSASKPVDPSLGAFEIIILVAALQELVPGEPQKLWVQSQSTYAVILRDDEGKLVPKTVKQKIWVEGISYELQEIYGMEHSVAAVKDKQVLPCCPGLSFSLLNPLLFGTGSTYMHLFSRS